MQKDTEVQGMQNTTNDISKNSLVNKSIIKDTSSYVIYKRSEKISRACFLVTSHVKDSDALKGKIRHLAVDLPFQTLKLVSGTLSDAELIKDISLSAATISSLLETSHAVGHISSANLGLMQSQIALFLDAVESEFSTERKLESIFTYDMWNLDNTQHSTSASDASATYEALGSTAIPQAMHPTHSAHSVSGSRHDGHKPTVQPISRKVAEPKKPIHPIDRAHPEEALGNPVKNERQTLILNTIRARGELSIKDLTTVIKGCSEKTIQRELITLVNNGDLLKSGERRWSRYSVAG